MAIKWKNRLLLFFSVLLFLIGWYGVEKTVFQLGMMNHSQETIPQDYLNAYYTKEYVTRSKGKNPNVSKDQIEAYRNRYGDLGNQVSNIQNQYIPKIKEAKEENDSKKESDLLKEQNNKINDIVANFSDDDVVKKKIIEEKTDYLNKNQKKILKNVEELSQALEDNYQFYLVDDESNKVYTNVQGLSQYSNQEDASHTFDKLVKDKEDIQSVNGYWSLASFVNNEEYVRGIFDDETANYHGLLTIKGNSSLIDDKKNEKKRVKNVRIIFSSAIVLMLIGLLLLYAYIKTPVVDNKFGRKISAFPVDVKIMIMLTCGLFAAISPINNYFYDVVKTVIPFTIDFILLCISFMFLKLVWRSMDKQFRHETKEILWQKSLCVKSCNRMKKTFYKLPVIFKLFVFSLIYTLDGYVIFKLTTYGMWYTLKSFIGSILVVLITIVTTLLLIKMMRKIGYLLSQPSIILNENKRPKTLEEVEAQLLELSQLVADSKKDTMQSEELKTELLTNVSHDLRTPLTSIITYGDLLTQETTTKIEQDKYITIINQKAYRMKGLIDDLFEVTKMNNGEIELNKSEVNVGQLLQQCVSEYSEELSQTNLKLVYHKPSEPIMVSLDGERMWRVFDNLIGNVVKYGMEGTRVYLKMMKQDNQVIIELKNISRYELHESAEHLIEKFKRGDESRHTDGSGLGLAIVNSIVLLHDGQLDIQVDGDMFKVSIYLPL